MFQAQAQTPPPTADPYANELGPLKDTQGKPEVGK